MNKLSQLSLSVLGVVSFTACATTKNDQAGTPDVSGIEAQLTRTAFAIADADGDGAVTFEELMEADPESQKERFRINDSDGSGALSQDEFEIGIDRRGGFLTLMSKVDLNRDNLISEAEKARFDAAISGAEDLDTFDQLRRILD